MNGSVLCAHDCRACREWDERLVSYLKVCDIGCTRMTWGVGDGGAKFDTVRLRPRE